MSVDKNYALAIDTSNEVIAVGLGEFLDGSVDFFLIEPRAEKSISAHRASNTMLIPTIQEVLESVSVSFDQLRCVAVGRGPGSFTGVRIAMATAKGISSALEIPLVGVSTQEAIAWRAAFNGHRGRLLVVGDAMRKEIYPAYFEITDDEVERLTSDRVIKAQEFADELSKEQRSQRLMIAGDALFKYRDLFDLSNLDVLPESDWTPNGTGLLKALQAVLNSSDIDLTFANFDPLTLLPVYTRLSDAEENERTRLAKSEARDLRTGVQGNNGTTESMRAGSRYEIEFKPLSAEYLSTIAAMEQRYLKSDAWNETMIADELPRRDRTWWVALDGDKPVGYAGALIAGDEMQLLKIVVDEAARRSGIGRELLTRVSEDARNLGAETATLEVRASNENAIAFYKQEGFASIGIRPKYYSDGEDALIMQRTKLLVTWDVESETAGKAVGERQIEPARPLILAIESSCDETAASIIDGEGALLANIVSSQIEFHARFGGVVPEIASRKHVEAIVGVVRAALEDADITWNDLDAVASTYAPGLVGALVVGVAFAKGAAAALNIPFIKVNHLEGHLFANKLDESGDVELPAIASLVSGGNTLLVLIKDWGQYEILGSTIDDAVGEAFDKVAKALGLPYPGGPQISKLAAKGDPDAIDFPRALMHSGDYNFSLSGLKTAVINHINKVKTEDGIPDIADICASFQQAVIDVQVKKAKLALQETGAKTFCLGGGVAANPALRDAYETMCISIGVRLIMPPLSVCGDNAAMIALVALERYKQWNFSDMTTDVAAHADLSQPY